MGEKNEQTMSRLELADYLKNLSEELRGGLAAQGRTGPCRTTLDVGMGFEEGASGRQARWSWSTLANL